MFYFNQNILYQLTFFSVTKSHSLWRNVCFGVLLIDAIVLKNYKFKSKCVASTTTLNQLLKCREVIVQYISRRMYLSFSESQSCIPYICMNVKCATIRFLSTSCVMHDKNNRKIIRLKFSTYSCGCC